MKILFLNQFAWPDSAPTSQLLTDVCRFLVSEGHEVDVVCGAATYLGGEADEQCLWQVHRVPCVAFGRGVKRILSYATFFAAAAWKVLRIPKPDLIVTMTTPPLLSLLGTLMAKARGDAHYIWEMDLFPEALSDTGMASKDSRFIRALQQLSDYSRRSSQGVIVLGTCMHTRIMEAGVPADRIHIAENWANGRLISASPIRKSSHLTVLYSGNYGLTHDLKTVASALESLAEPAIRFRFVGGGRRYEQLRALSAERGFSNATFEDYCGNSALSANLASCDVGLVTQLASCLGTVVPSKIYGLLAAGRPILYVGPRESTAAQIIKRHRCGWQIDNDDPGGLVALLLWLKDNPESIEAAALRGRQAFSQHYDLPVGVRRVAHILGAVVEAPVTEPDAIHVG